MCEPLVDLLPSIVARKQTGGGDALGRRPADAQGADQMDFEDSNSIVLAASLPVHETTQN